MLIGDNGHSHVNKSGYRTSLLYLVVMDCWKLEDSLTEEFAYRDSLIHIILVVFKLLRISYFLQSSRIWKVPSSEQGGYMPQLSCKNKYTYVHNFNILSYLKKMDG